MESESADSKDEYFCNLFELREESIVLHKIHLKGLETSGAHI